MDQINKKTRKFKDQTEQEVRQIVQDIFNPKRISNIKVHKRDDEITCNIYTEWVSKDDDGKEEVTTCKDEIALSNPFDNGEDAIHADFSIRKDDYIKLKQFCFAKEIYGESISWMFNNPYEIKALEQEPKKGRWITQWNIVHQKEYYYCSECREEFSYDGETGIKMNDYNYCPNCGAKMRNEV